MEILTYTPDLVGNLTALYNKSTERVPNYWPVEEEEFAHAWTERSGRRVMAGLTR